MLVVDPLVEEAEAVDRTLPPEATKGAEKQSSILQNTSINELELNLLVEEKVSVRTLS